MIQREKREIEQQDNGYLNSTLATPSLTLSKKRLQKLPQVAHNNKKDRRFFRRSFAKYYPPESIRIRHNVLCRDNVNNLRILPLTSYQLTLMKSPILQNLSHHLRF